jgi:hypothetical protein
MQHVIIMQNTDPGSFGKPEAIVEIFILGDSLFGFYVFNQRIFIAVDDLLEIVMGRMIIN